MIAAKIYHRTIGIMTMISPDLNIAPDSNSEVIQIGFDAGAKYYVLSKTETIIRKGELHIEATKKLVITIAQAEKLRDDLNNFFGIHERYK
jgi:hypothetical protein